MPKTGIFSLPGLRSALGLTQAEMAHRMGLSLRPYQILESKDSKVRRRHVRLAESVALDLAIEQENPELAPVTVRNKAIRFARLIIRDRFRQRARRLTDIILDEEE
jgi:transcriptional regulator with XRE-family HTH domain